MGLALLGLAYAAAALVAALSPSAQNWGIHAAAFLPPVPRSLVFALLASGAALLVIAARNPEAEAAVASARRAAEGNLKPWALWLLPPTFGAVSWIFRTRTHLLGDQALWIDRLSHQVQVSDNEPLAALVWGGFRALLTTLGTPILPSTLAILPALCGVAAALLCAAIGRELFAGRRVVWFMILVLLTGASQLYFGYIETYPIVAVSVLLYLWLALSSLNGRAPLWITAAGLALAVSSHLATLYLFPSYWYIVFRRPVRRIGRLILIALPILFTAALFAFLEYGGERLSRPLRVIWSAFRIAAGPGNTGASLSPARGLVDLGNILLLVAPVPLILLLHEYARRKNPLRTLGEGGAFLGIAAAMGLLLGFVLCLPGSPAQDWDLLAIGVLPLAVLGVGSAQDVLWRRGMSFTRMGLVLLSAGGLFGFVALNADHTAGIRRFAMLIGESVALSPHERSYGNEKLGNYYDDAGDPSTAIGYFKRALEGDPANSRYWGKVGEVLYRMGRFAEAAPFFVEAVHRGAPQGPTYYYLGYCYLQMGEPERAAPILWDAIKAKSNESRYWGAYGLALVASGDLKRGRDVWRTALLRWPHDQEILTAYRAVFHEDPFE